MSKVVAYTIATMVAVSVLADSSRAEDSDHNVSETTISNGPADEQRLENQLEQDARYYAKIGSVDRFVEFDSALPRDAGEYAQLGGFGIVLIEALSHDATELPIKRAYLRSGGKEIPLHELYSLQTETHEGSVARTVFGQFREYAFFLVPMGPAMGEHVLLCDFAGHRSGFVVDNAPFDPPTYMVPSLYREAGAMPAAAVLRDFVQREWPGVARGLTEASIK